MRPRLLRLVVLRTSARRLLIRLWTRALTLCVVEWPLVRLVSVVRRPSRNDLRCLPSRRKHVLNLRRLSLATVSTNAVRLLRTGSSLH